MQRRWMAALLLLALLAVVAVPAASAGVLTSSGYTYLFKGRELEVPVDILTVQGAVLAPAELLHAFGLASAADGESVTLERGPVTVELELGSDVARMNGQVRLLKAGPLRVGGRLFLPAEVLPDLGLSLAVDGKFVLLADYLAPVPAPAAEPEAGAPVADPSEPALPGHTLEATAREGSDVLRLKVVALTPALLSDPALGIPWGTQARLRSLIETRTLLLVTLTNQSYRAVALDPARLLLVGEGGRQYDYLRQEINIEGAVTALTAPGASHTSVLAYPKVAGAQFDLYYDGAHAVLGRLPAQ